MGNIYKRHDIMGLVSLFLYMLLLSLSKYDTQRLSLIDSEVGKDYPRNHPDEGCFFSKVMKRAWSKPGIQTDVGSILNSATCVSLANIHIFLNRFL